MLGGSAEALGDRSSRRQAAGQGGIPRGRLENGSERPLPRMAGRRQRSKPPTDRQLLPFFDPAWGYLAILIENNDCDLKWETIVRWPRRL